MNHIKPILFSFFILLGASMTAQDIHWTMYNMSPLTLNPARTGDYDGTYRFGGIYRDQFNNITGATGFKTPSFYFDTPTIKGFSPNDRVGVGAVLFNDQAGIGRLTTLGTFASLAYHLSLNTSGTTYLSIGFQGGLIQRKIDGNDPSLLFEDELLSGSQGTSANRGLIADNTRFFDVNAGLQLSTKIGNNTDGKIGITVRHILQPEYNLNTNEIEYLPRRITAHGSFNIELNSKWSVSPSFIFDDMNKMQEGMITGLLGYQFSDDLAFRLGGGYRFGDAAAPILAVDFRQLRVALSYDVTLSELSDINGGQGGFEIGLWYVVKKAKKQEIKEVIFCPRF